MQALQDKFLSFAAYGSQKGETSLDSRSFVKLFKVSTIRNCVICDKEQRTQESRRVIVLANCVNAYALHSRQHSHDLTR
jgi:hypothetical protein